MTVLCGISTGFPVLSPSKRQVAHALLTRSPLSSLGSFRKTFFAIIVRLACVKHAASVRPEPGSNSQFKFIVYPKKGYIVFLKSLSVIVNSINLLTYARTSLLYVFTVHFSRTVVSLLFMSDFDILTRTPSLCQADFFNFFYVFSVLTQPL